MTLPITIDTLKASGALDLAWRVFLEFEAPDYTDEGVGEFRDFIALDAVRQKMRKGELHLWGYYDADTLVGMLATRQPCHIALLFVEKGHHRKGIARSLLHTALAYYKETSPSTEITVNSSPYAVNAYRKLGFVDTDTEQTVNGLRFTPMKHIFR